MRQNTLSYQTTLLWLVLADLLCALGAYWSAFCLRVYLPLPFTTDLLPSSRFAEVSHPLVFLLMTQVVLLYFFGFYELHALQRRGRLVAPAAAALGVQLLTTTAWYFFRRDLSFPRTVLVLFWLLNTLGVAGLRLWVVHRLRQAGPQRILLVGTEVDVQAFLSSLPELRPFPDFAVAGLVSLNGRSGAPDEGGVPWLGSTDDLPRIIQQVRVDDVLLLSPATWKDVLVDRLLQLTAGQRAGERPRLLVVPSMYDILVGRVSSLRLHDVPLVEVLKNPQEDLAFFMKGVLDKAIAGLLLVLGFPVLLVAALLIKLTSSGPILYCQQRVGRGGKKFTLYKLRTMVDGAEQETGPVLAGPADERVTWVGRFLRKTRIDEIPQLFNVLDGTMSLVGPRPERPEFVGEFLRTIPGYAERLQVKPGLTGLAQVDGEYHTTPEYKLKYDLAYIYNYSLWLDMRIMAETVKVILTRQGV
ncbi:MAG TPA: sugar transferase [Candidatus Binatia bacterium]|nr:sugar transferase [Candidatus Binatia bacterium]